MRHGHPWRVQTDGARGKSRDIRPEGPRDEFDELVVGQWLHIERMDTRYWWMQVAGLCFSIWHEQKRGSRPARWRISFTENRNAGCGYDDGPRDVTCPKCGAVTE